VGAVGHPFAAAGRHGVLRQGSWWARSINGATTPRAHGGHDLHDPRPTTGLPTRSRRRIHGVRGCWRAQATQPAVTQPVEHQLGQLAGGGDHADVAAPAGGDPVADLPEPGVSTDALHGLDRGPADQATALFICGTTVVKPRGTCAQISLFESSSVAVGRGRAVPGSRLGRQPDRVAAAGPGRRRRPTASSPGVGEDRGCGSAVAHDRSWRGWAWPRVSRGASGAPAYLGARPGARVRRQDGDRGVSTGCGRSFLVGCPAHRPAATGLPGADRGFIGCSGATRSLGVRGQAAGARTWSSRLRRVWWQRRASLRAIDSSANWPPRRALTCWK